MAASSASVTPSSLPVITTPTVHIPARKPGSALVTKRLVSGHGPKLTAGESYLANFDIFLWRGKTNRLLFSSFTSTPEVLPVTMGLTGLQKALGREIPITSLFEFTTVRSLAQHLGGDGSSAPALSEAQQRAQRQRAAFARQRERKVGGGS